MTKRPRGVAAVILVMGIQCTIAAPRTPASDAEVLADLPAGVRHIASPAQALTATRLDVALPLAQLNISRARTTGDMRYLGYAEAILAPWLKRPNVAPEVLILDATILQSRHAFDAALGELDRALALRSDEPQAWLTRATILRVLGRYDEALAACEHLRSAADPAVARLCAESLRGLMGHLQEAYSSILSLSAAALPPQVEAWRLSELGEMAERLGNDAAAEAWFRQGLALAPQDFYMRAAYVDLLLRHEHPAEALKLLTGYESMEPMLLRATIAHRELQDGLGAEANAQLSMAFAIEEQRGDAVHRRELARYLLDIEHKPAAALAAAQVNWQVQREPDDLLVLLRAAYAAHQPQAAETALAFVRESHLEDSRLNAYRGTTG
jgi:tetratricopeptide (TPR) repeat protein